MSHYVFSEYENNGSMADLILGESVGKFDNQAPLWERARGRWYGILSHLGVSGRFLTRRNGPCPICGGKDRWRWTDWQGAGSWVCNKCGTGTGADLVMALRGCEFREAAKMIEDVIGKAEPEHRQERSDAECRAAMREVWDSGVEVTPSCPAGLYLARRVPGLVTVPKTIRYVPWLRHGNQQFPAMVVKIASPQSVAVQIQRTWITFDGQKAPLEQPRKLMPGTLPPGSAAYLGRITDGRLGIAEGVETALSASLRFGRPFWSVLSAGNMVHFRPPVDVTDLLICADHDLSYTGQAAAYCAARDIVRDCQRDGRAMTVRVVMPDKPGTDFADFGTCTS